MRNLWYLEDHVLYVLPIQGFSWGSNDHLTTTHVGGIVFSWGSEEKATHLHCETEWGYYAPTLDSHYDRHTTNPTM